jgi:short-subunit dehydrogenase
MIVTGASSGIGRALAVAAARRGFVVLLAARRAQRLDEVARGIRAHGGSCETLVVDVCSPDAPARIVTAAVAAFGRIDVVVNNAGAGAYGELLAQSDAATETQWQLHVAAPLRIARAALAQVERARGQFVFVGSGLSRVPLPAYGAYAPVKAAVRAAAIQLRRELRVRGIAVTYVDPGLVATEFHGAMGIERSSRVKAATPERVADAILRGIRRRRATVNAVPWQTAGTVAGEWLATLADPVIARIRPQRHVEPAPAAPTAPDATKLEPSTLEPVDAVPEAPPAATLEAALESVARRMERVKLSQTFVREALVPGVTLELNELAMRWAGMPNKNERAAMREVLDALAGAGYLEPMGDETWKVVRAPP